MLNARRRVTGPAAMSGMVSLWGASSLIQSIQTGTISMAGVASNTATIAAVDLAHSVVVFQGCTISTDNGLPGSTTRCAVTLTNATTVTANRITGTDTAVLAYTVMEFAPGVIKSLQSGTIIVSGATSNTATITTVNVAKTWLIVRGFFANDGNVGEYSGRTAASVVLTNATTVTAAKGVATNYSEVHYTAMELF